MSKPYRHVKRAVSFAQRQRKYLKSAVQYTPSKASWARARKRRD